MYIRPHAPAQVIEHTIRAALEIDWPADKLTVLLLDDGGSPGTFVCVCGWMDSSCVTDYLLITTTEAALLVERLQEELLAARPKERRPTLRYVAR